MHEKCSPDLWIAGEKVMYCGNCGKELEEGSRFCPHCGCAVEEEALESPVDACAAQGRQPKRKGQKKWWILVLVLVVAAIAIGVGIAVSKIPEKGKVPDEKEAVSDQIAEEHKEEEKDRPKDEESQDGQREIPEDKEQNELPDKLPDDLEPVPTDLDVESEVLRIRKIYNDIQDHVGEYSTTSFEEGTICGTHYISADGRYRKTIIKADRENVEYERQYFYEDGKLIFAFCYKGKEENRYYFYHERMFRWIDPEKNIYDKNFDDSLWQSREMEVLTEAREVYSY